MKIKNIFRAGLLCMVVCATATGCRFEENDLFSESASLRLDHTNEEVEDILCSASNKNEAQAESNGQYGWCIQYFVAGNDDYSYPGYNMYGQFYDDGSVAISGDHEYIKGSPNKWTTCTSVWEMIKEEGSVLSFDTWNDVLTPFVDPNTIEGEEGTGMYGDQNLVVMEYNNDEITFRGERHSSRIHFVRLDRPILQYVADVKVMQTQIDNTVANPYVISNGTYNSYIINLNSGRMKMLDRIEDPLNQKERPLVFTPDGFRMERECQSLDSTYKFLEFVYDESKDLFVEKSNNSITIDAAYTNPSEYFIKSLTAKMYESDKAKTWYMDTNSDMSEKLRDDFTAMEKAMVSYKNHKLAFAWDTKSNKFSITLSYKISTINISVAYTFDFEVTDSGFKLSNPHTSKSLTGKFKTAMVDLMNDFATEFKAEETDSKWSRSNIKIASTDGTIYTVLNLNVGRKR